MAKSSDLLQGQTDMLILKAVSLGPLHGYGVLLRIQQISGERLQIQQGSVVPCVVPPRAPGPHPQRVGGVGQQTQGQVRPPTAPPAGAVSRRKRATGRAWPTSLPPSSTRHRRSCELWLACAVVDADRTPAIDRRGIAAVRRDPGRNWRWSCPCLPCKMAGTMDPILLALREKRARRARRRRLQRRSRASSGSSTHRPDQWPGRSSLSPLSAVLFLRPFAPAGFSSCICAGAAQPAPERHPNSHQRLFSLVGNGTFELHDGARWLAHPLVSNDAGGAERWVSIPPSTWHRLVVGPRTWGLVSFHTVTPEELIEEKPVDPDDLDGATHQELVLREELIHVPTSATCQKAFNAEPAGERRRLGLLYFFEDGRGATVLGRR